MLFPSKKRKGKSLWAEGQKVSVLCREAPVAHPPIKPASLAFTLQEVKNPICNFRAGERLGLLVEQTECKVGPSLSRLLAVRPWMNLSEFLLLPL